MYLNCIHANCIALALLKSALCNLMQRIEMGSRIKKATVIVTVIKQRKRSGRERGKKLKRATGMKLESRDEFEEVSNSVLFVTTKS